MYEDGFTAPVLLLSLAIAFIHASMAFLILKFSSLITVTVQFSIVLSPATFRIRPLKGTSIDAIVDAGSLSSLTHNSKVFLLFRTPGCCWELNF
jgi:hypothetical protein